MGNIERSWTIRNVDGGPLTVRQNGRDVEPWLTVGEEVEVVPAEQLRGAVEAGQLMGNIERSREHNAAVAKLRDEWDNDHTASPGTYSRWLEARVVTLAQQHAGAVDLLHEVAVSGVEHEDPRIGYVAVQIDRETWDALATYRGQSGAAPREETT